MPQPSTSDEVIITCFNCVLQIQRTVHIKCAECPESVCLPCFQFGAESGKHRRGHNYEIIDPNSSQNGGWGNSEESRLLKAVHQFKMGNWGEIVESMGDSTLAKEAKDYFDRIFVRGWIGQFAIKSGDWERIKYEMFKNGTLDSVLKQNAPDSTERLLMIRDALFDSNTKIDENDPKLNQKIQNILENYVQKCVDGRIEMNYKRPKVGPSQYETELSYDEFDPASGDEFEQKSKIKKYDEDSDEGSDSSPPVLNKTPKARPTTSGSKRKPSRIFREASSDTEAEIDEMTQEDDETFHGLDREEEENDEEVYDSACEEMDNMEEDTEDESDEKKPKETKGASLKTKKRKRRRPQWFSSKKSRKLKSFTEKMAHDLKKKEKELEKINDLCPLEEMKELRNALPKMALETRTTVNHEDSRMRVDDTKMVGYNEDREEFEREWFPDAEQLISRLIITPAPAQKDVLLDIENDLKFIRVQHYIRILGMRRAKRNAILEHDKITEFFDFLKLMTIEKRSAKEVMEDKEEIELILTRAQQFLNREEFNGLRDCIKKVDDLTERIAKLQEMQRNGETTLKNVPTPSTNCKRKKIRKIDLDAKRKAGLEWAKYKRWHHNASQE